jgi:hypothetical protein
LLIQTIETTTSTKQYVCFWTILLSDENSERVMYVVRRHPKLFANDCNRRQLFHSSFIIRIIYYLRNSIKAIGEKTNNTITHRTKVTLMVRQSNRCAINWTKNVIESLGNVCDAHRTGALKLSIEKQHQLLLKHGF